MITEIKKTDGESLALAKKIMTIDHGLVAFPTETVYGLGAVGTDSVAVKKIYEVKGRPSDNPLIAHVHKDYDVSQLVYKEQPYIDALIKKFIPGPLTLVYYSKKIVVKEATCDGDTLAIRIPSHKDAQAFLRYLDLPIVAPSANVSKHVSPVTAEHVFNDLNGKIELILDGGKCSGGIESTVLDVTTKVPRLLRPGLVTREMIAEVAGDCEIAKHLEGDKVRSPGVKYKHYSPRCKTVLFEDYQIEDIISAYKDATKQGLKTYVLCANETAVKLGIENILNLGNTPEEMAANLYAALLDGEKKADLIIGVEPSDTKGVLLGVVNRLSKACAPNP